MNATAAIVRLDVRGIGRDQVMLINVALSAATMVAITVLGVFQQSLPGWLAWFPFMIALSLVSGPGGFGYMFGLLMVDENDSGVREALTVTPVTPARLLLTRSAVATLWMCLWPLFTVAVMNSTWRALELSAVEWMTLVGSLALLTPACALAIPTFAKDKVEALAVFKGVTFATLAPLALYFIDAEAAYRPLFLVIPTAWAVFAFDAFVAGDAMGYAWAAGGAIYALLLLALVVELYRRKVYRLERGARATTTTRGRKLIGAALLAVAVISGIAALAVPLLGLPVGRAFAIAGALVVAAKVAGLAALLLLGREFVARLRAKLGRGAREPTRT
jgi:hypothetical protein